MYSFAFARLHQHLSNEGRGPAIPSRADLRSFPLFRHAFGTQHIMNGGDPFSLQKILGRSDITTTMIYVNLAGVGLRGAHAKASSVGRSPARD
jgi:integrase